MVPTGHSNIRHLLPSRSMTPIAFGVNLLWLLCASVGLSYLALASSITLPDVDIHSFTSLFLAATWLALAQLLAIVVGSWLIYAYLYLVAAPTVHLIEHGRPVTHLSTTVAGSILRFFIRMAYAWITLLAGFSRESIPFLRAAPLPLIRDHLPPHLAAGWRAATHPQVLYDPALR